MQNIENILYSLIPLILIILFSWLFSLLGSKMKKPGENSEAPAGKNFGDRLIDMMKEGAEEVPSRETGRVPVQQIPGGPFPMDTRVGVTQQSGSPIITAKPITPKWWGA